MPKAWLFFGVSMVVACSGEPLQPGPKPTGSDSSVMPGTTADASAPGSESTADASSGYDGPICAPLPASPLCSQSPTGTITVQSMSDLVAAMTGRWILCGNESVFAVDGGDIGLEITADNHWYKLYEAQGGTTIRGAGWDQEGTWTALAVGDGFGDHFQVNFDISGSGTVITAPVFASTPQAMRLDNNGVFVGNYVIDPSVPTGSVRCAPQPDPTRSGDCTPPPDTLINYQACTSDLALAQLVGRWSRCGGSMPGAPPHDGIELSADGSFYFLHDDPTAGLIRGTSAAETGTATVLVGANCQTDITINTAAGVSILSAGETYQTTPRQLWIYTGPEWGDPERYTFVSP